MHRSDLLLVINRLCYRSNGQLNSCMIHKKHWISCDHASAYDILMSKCGHPDAKLAQVVYHVINDLPVLNPCSHPQCNNLAKWSSAKSAYLQTCGKKCASSLPGKIEKWRQTNFDKHGTGNYAQSTTETLTKRKETCIEKFGTDSYSKTNKFKDMMTADNPMHDTVIVQKQKHTLMSRYGTHPLNIAEFVDKLNRTSTEKYGTKFPMQSDIVKQNYQDAMSLRYGVSNPKHLMLSDDARALLFDCDKFTKLLDTLTVTEISVKYNIDKTTIYNYIHRYGMTDLLKSNGSQTELIFETLINPDITTIRNDRSILNGKELDFYFPDYNLAIEINGIYWHSTASPAKRDKNYHFDKWKACNDKGITLLSYTDADVIHNRDIITCKLLYLFGSRRAIIGARKCQIGKIDKQAEFELLDRYHIQGRLHARSGSLGAYYNNRLIAVINWNIRKDYLEITRFCCDTNASYPGLFSRMTKAMIKETGFSGKIVSFSNNDHSNGNVYAKSGFILDKILGPAYWYTKDFATLENRQRYMKSKIADRFGIDMTNKTEWQAMQELGYHRYYDSGKIKWVLHT